MKCCVVAGYSFRDDRINKMLEEAVIARKGDLNLLIVDPNNDIIRAKQFLKLYGTSHIKDKLSNVLSDGSLYKKTKKIINGELEPKQENSYKPTLL